MHSNNKDYSFYEKIEMETILAPNFKTKDFKITYFKKDVFMFIGVVSGTFVFNDPKYPEFKDLPLKAGSGLLLAPDTVLHNVKTEKCDLRCIIIYPALLEVCCKFLSNDLFSFLTEKSVHHCILPIENMFSLENFCEQFTNCISPEIQVEISKNIVMFLLNHFIISENDAYSNYPSIVKKILSILNFMQNILDGIPPVIYELGYSKSYICRIFKKYVGMSITNYITNMKLKHSVFILRRKNLSISEVCEELHYESVPYFTKIFKKKYGITPAKYRNQLNE